MSYKVFTVENGRVSSGTKIEMYKISSAGTKIPAVLVGEEGRGRSLGVLVVKNQPMTDCPEIGRSIYKYSGSEQPYTCPYCGEIFTGTTCHPNQGKVPQPLVAADVGKTRSGKPCLIAAEKATDNDKVIVVFKTDIGFRGGNSHTGDVLQEFWVNDSLTGFPPTVPDKERYSKEEVLAYSPVIMKWKWPNDDPKSFRWDAGFAKRVEYQPFPGEVLVEGVIAQGAAGRMGSGKQLVAVMPKDVVFRTGYSGRLYGAPREHFYRWDGQRLISLTAKDREVSELF